MKNALKETKLIGTDYFLFVFPLVMEYNFSSNSFYFSLYNTMFKLHHYSFKTKLFAINLSYLYLPIKVNSPNELLILNAMF